MGSALDMDIMGKTRADLAHNAIVYQYPCGVTDIICSSSMDFGMDGWEDRGEPPRPSKREPGKTAEGCDMERSMRRARAMLRRYALANDFEWFVTLTLDPARIDRTDGKAVAKALGRWADNMVRRKGLRYILVPELHQKGGIHFHGFFSGPGLEAVPSGHYDRRGHEIFNLPQWGLGFTAAIRLYGDYPQAVAYVTKYIGKQEGQRPMGRWYYSGGALAQPTKVYADLDPRQLQAAYGDAAFTCQIPGRELTIIHTREDEHND